jgi:hypothetical protein
VPATIADTRKIAIASKILQHPIYFVVFLLHTFNVYLIHLRSSVLDASYLGHWRSFE